MLQQTYFFKPDRYDRHGQRIDDPAVLFHHFIEECETDFYSRSSPLAANRFKANARTMLLLQACFEIEEESFGMDGDQDLETNMRIDAHSEKVTIFAIESSIPEKEDEPLFLLIDDSVPDGQFELLYVPDEGDDEEGVSPTDGKREKVSLEAF